jgi:ApbE superfamily uncharacterized protein (UPF0280 family)
LNDNLTGNNNIGIGDNAGSAITTGSNNVIIGTYAGTSNLSDTVVIAAGQTERLRVTSAGLAINGASFPGPFPFNYVGSISGTANQIEVTNTSSGNSTI